MLIGLTVLGVGSLLAAMMRWIPFWVTLVVIAGALLAVLASLGYSAVAQGDSILRVVLGIGVLVGVSAVIGALAIVLGKIIFR